MTEVSAQEFEQGIQSVFWEALRARLWAMRTRYMTECCKEGCQERRADGLRVAIETLNIIVGTEARSSLPEVMLEEFLKESKES